MPQRKHNYHPLVIFFFYAGMLEKNISLKIDMGSNMDTSAQVDLPIETGLILHR